ncbi:E3 ubiquitin-protein ligase TRAIP-like [Sitodiplosis mosellana]|uniref:E3 ubiquitin-protein ligase TRAIP-like n=1 Tax=Sitodiplosis mosellana TaxID=263140 RepID=UPI0024441A47|nr:E3 ubiquitin-protein ligase TRAIP-like [Sitodiplosis mosellana]
MPDVLCSICYDSLVQKEDDILITECGHLYHSKCLSKWRPKGCAECRADISVTKKVFLFYMDLECADIPISADILMKTNANLLDQLTENAEEMENLVATCSALELQTCSMQKECDDKRAKIRSMEKVVAARNKTITSKEQDLRLLQCQVKDLKTENGALKKSNHELATQLKDQKAVETKMKNIMAENQRLRHLLDTKPAPNVNSSGDNANTKKKGK